MSRIETAKETLINFFGNKLQQAHKTVLDHYVDIFFAVDDQDPLAHQVLTVSPLPFLVPYMLSPKRFPERVLNKQPYTQQLLLEYTPQEVRKSLGFLLSDISPISLGFTVAIVLDYLNRHPEENEPYLPVSSSHQSNLDYLRQKTNGAIDDQEIRSDISVKLWAGRQLVNCGLADPQTRFCADPISTTIRIVELLNQERIPWISTCLPQDFADCGLTRAVKEPAYSPQPTRLETALQRLALDCRKRHPEDFVSLRAYLDKATYIARTLELSLGLDQAAKKQMLDILRLPIEELIKKLNDPSIVIAEEYKQSIIWFLTLPDDQYRHYMDQVKIQHPELFPIDKSAPLFRDIKTLKQFYTQVLPQLLVLSSEFPQAVFKVFPQDEKGVSIAAMECDTIGTPELGPRFIFEMGKNTYTPRGEVKEVYKVDWYPKYNLLVGNCNEAVLVFNDIFANPTRSGLNFQTALQKLYQETHVSRGTIEFMVEEPDQRNFRVAFATDFNPSQNPDPNTRPQFLSAFADFSQATVVTPEIERERLRKRGYNSTNDLDQINDLDLLANKLFGLAHQLGQLSKAAIMRDLAVDLEQGYYPLTLGSGSLEATKWSLNNRLLQKDVVAAHKQYRFLDGPLEEFHRAIQAGFLSLPEFLAIIKK